MEIGAQFYTIREHCRNLEDFALSLRKVADIGYKNVQISGVCPYEPQWLKEQLQKNDLKCVLTHTPKDAMIGDPHQVARDHDVFDCRYIGLGGAFFDSKDAYQASEAFVREIRPTLEAFREHNKYFMYHNHAHEFQKREGIPILEYYARNIPAELMGFTVDTYWVQYGGGDPAALIGGLSGRVPCIHLKDYAYNGGPKMAVVGEGNLNFNRIFQAAEAAGTRYMLVEQDDCYGEDPFACLKRSYENLRAFGFR